MGYTIAGYQLFGHLFVDFSNISRGATALIVMLVSWDSSSTIVQVRIDLILYSVKFDFQLKTWDILVHRSFMHLLNGCTVYSFGHGSC